MKKSVFYLTKRGRRRTSAVYGSAFPCFVPTQIRCGCVGNVIHYFHTIPWEGTGRHFDMLRHHRSSMRLRGYDYSSEGAYYVTICTRYSECTMGDVVNDEMEFSDSGRIVEGCWRAIPNDFSNATLDEFQVMPNHLHGIVVLWPDNVRNLDGKDHSVRDLINQIPTGNPTPLGLSSAKFSHDIDWPLMKNSKQTLGMIIRHFKAKATKEIHDAGFHGFAWQGRFHDHIIRDEEELYPVR